MSVEVTQQEIATLIEYAGEDKVVHFTDYLLNRVSKSTGVKRFHSGFSAFDEKIGGIETGEVVVVSGHTKNGKTLFAESWVKSIVEREPRARAMFFSFEVQTEKLLLKYQGTPEIQIFVPETLKTMDFDWLRQRCLEGKLKHDCSIVLVDHLHFLVDMNTKQNMSLNIGAFMRRLKHEIAIGLNMAVILIAHQQQPKDGQAATVNSIRDSSFVAQECDSALIVQRRKNFSMDEIMNLRTKYGMDKGDLIERGYMEDDDYSCSLATVEVARTRRTGVFEYKKLFKKVGEFMVEV